MFQFKARHLKIYGNTLAPHPAKSGGPSRVKTKALLRELSDDEDDRDNLSIMSSTPPNPEKPWLKEFNDYLNTKDSLLDGQTIVQWWGVS